MLGPRIFENTSSIGKVYGYETDTIPGPGQVSLDIKDKVLVTLSLWAKVQAYLLGA